VSGFRYFGGAVAFGFAAMWIMASLRAALVCLLSAVIGYGMVIVAERARARLAARAGRPGVPASAMLVPPRPTREGGDLAQWADALNSDLGHVYEPAATMSPLSREAEYGWPLIEDTTGMSESLH
jgi:hypothetical protein